MERDYTYTFKSQFVSVTKKKMVIEGVIIMRV
jgi:hypothetical protein